MITRETAERIWCAYREIEASRKLLADMEGTREDEHLDKLAPTLKDAFGRRRHLELGVPSGSGGHRIFQVSPPLARSVILSHIAAKKAELAEANEQARVELDTSQGNDDGLSVQLQES